MAGLHCDNMPHLPFVCVEYACVLLLYMYLLIACLSLYLLILFDFFPRLNSVISVF